MTRHDALVMTVMAGITRHDAISETPNPPPTIFMVLRHLISAHLPSFGPVIYEHLGLRLGLR